METGTGSGSGRRVANVHRVRDVSPPTSRINEMTPEAIGIHPAPRHSPIVTRIPFAPGGSTRTTVGSPGFARRFGFPPRSFSSSSGPFVSSLR